MPLTLQPLTEADVAFAIDAENHPDNRRFVGQWTAEQYRNALADPNYQCFVFMANGERVGHCLLYDLQNPDNAVLLKRIVIQAKGNGYGRAALHELAQYTFKILKANRLWLDVRAFNDRAKSLYESVGFVCEGTLRRASRVDDDYVDLNLYGLLREEYVEK
ncbi:GNAT family N-acetyltransferase [Spirosoma montaniterrae]|uniref:N-acetyltransferase domain-containing protein n=1 Tax=Spirosoma montaniterrae TaxID=1178516 RepID=A0A1P9WVJ4_9BACT|nr:GNAT family protein [Spirosoma montaniterrae]AQG79405.1 hypothetical protein AWR27_08780 [Spirosoma montaniterrae]